MVTATESETAYMIVAQGVYVYYSRILSWARAVESLMREKNLECYLALCHLKSNGELDYSDLADHACNDLDQINLDEIHSSFEIVSELLGINLGEALLSMPYYHAVVIKGRESCHAIVDKDLVHVTESAVAQGIVIVAESTVSEEVILKKFFDDDHQRLLARIEQEYGLISIEMMFTSPHQGG